MATYCPVCNQEPPECEHRDHETAARMIRARALRELRPAAQTPVDMGVARFAADVIALLATPGDCRG